MWSDAAASRRRMVAHSARSAALMIHLRCITRCGHGLFSPEVTKTTRTSPARWMSPPAPITSSSGCGAMTSTRSEFTVFEMERREPSLKCRRPQYRNELAGNIAVEAVRAGVEPARTGVSSAVERAGRLTDMPHDHVVAGDGDGEAAVVADQRSRGPEAAHVHELPAEELLRSTGEERSVGLRDVASRLDDRLRHIVRNHVPLHHAAADRLKDVVVGAAAVDRLAFVIHQQLAGTRQAQDLIHHRGVLARFVAEAIRILRGDGEEKNGDGGECGHDGSRPPYDRRRTEDHQEGEKRQRVSRREEDPEADQVDEEDRRRDAEKIAP